MKTTFRNNRIFATGGMILALLVVVAAAWAAPQTDETTHDGTIVSIIGDKLVMANHEGQEHSHTLADDAKLTLDGEACKAADLKTGAKIRVTTNGADKAVATRIEALDKNSAFANQRLEGKLVSIIGDQLIMTGMKGKQEQTCILAADAEITCDGKVCKSGDLNPGMKIRVSHDSDDPHLATRVEAIDRNPEFASDRHDGKIVSISGNRLVMTSMQGREEQSCTMTADVKITCDGKICKLAELKPGMRVRVTMQGDDPHTATQVEAIVLNPGFAIR